MVIQPDSKRRRPDALNGDSGRAAGVGLAGRHPTEGTEIVVVLVGVHAVRAALQRLRRQKGPRVVAGVAITLSNALQNALVAHAVHHRVALLDANPELDELASDTAGGLFAAGTGPTPAEWAFADAAPGAPKDPQNEP